MTATVEKKAYTVIADGPVADQGHKRKGDTVMLYPDQARFLVAPYGRKLAPVAEAEGKTPTKPATGSKGKTAPAPKEDAAPA